MRREVMSLGGAHHYDVLGLQKMCTRVCNSFMGLIRFKDDTRRHRPCRRIDIRVYPWDQVRCILGLSCFMSMDVDWSDRCTML